MNNSVFKSISFLFLVSGLGLLTLAPYGGCSCNNPVSPSGGPTPMPTPTHSAIVDNFENDAATYPLAYNNWGGAFEPSFDTLGKSSLTVTFDAPAVPGASGSAMHMKGNYGTTSVASPSCGGSPYPFVAMRMYLTRAGKSGYENLMNYGSTGIRFKAYSVNAANNKLIVKAEAKALIDWTDGHPSPPCTNYNAYHYHGNSGAPATMSTTGFTTIAITWTQLIWGGSWGADALAIPWASTTLLSNPASQNPPGLPVYAQIVALQFEPVMYGPTYGVAYPYDFYIDDLEIF